jgi:hypothetical protein
MLTGTVEVAIDLTSTVVHRGASKRAMKFKELKP